MQKFWQHVYESVYKQYFSCEIMYKWCYISDIWKSGKLSPKLSIFGLARLESESETKCWSVTLATTVPYGNAQMCIFFYLVHNFVGNRVYF